LADLWVLGHEIRRFTNPVAAALQVNRGSLLLTSQDFNWLVRIKSSLFEAKSGITKFQLLVVGDFFKYFIAKYVFWSRKAIYSCNSIFLIRISSNAIFSSGAPQFVSRLLFLRAMAPSCWKTEIYRVWMNVAN